MDLSDLKRRAKNREGEPTWEDIDDLLQEIDILSIEDDLYCTNCGSCGVEDCCAAPRCSFFSIYIKTPLAERLKESEDDVANLKRLLAAKAINERR